MHFRPHPKGYMRKVAPVLPWTMKNSTLYKKVIDKQYDVCVITVCQLLGTYKKEIYYGDDAIEKAIKILKPFKDDVGANRTVERYRKREKVYVESIKEILDWDLHVTVDGNDTVTIALKKK